MRYQDLLCEHCISRINERNKEKARELRKRVNSKYYAKKKKAREAKKTHSSDEKKDDSCEKEPTEMGEAT